MELKTSLPGISSLESSLESDQEQISTSNSPIFSRNKDTIRTESPKKVIPKSKSGEYHHDIGIGYICVLNSYKYKLDYFYINKKEPCFHVFHSMNTLYETTRDCNVKELEKSSEDDKKQPLVAKHSTTVLNKPLLKYYMVEYDKNNSIITIDKIMTNKVKFIKDIHWKVLRELIHTKIINLNNIGDNTRYIKDCMLTFEKSEMYKDLNCIIDDKDSILFLLVLLLK